jgi:ribonuclease BN (tRNA processing enzyme)/pimeloyl-ACP methyl ester carboxylesterase
VTVDGHPIAVWEKRSPHFRRALLLVHGRTWSSIPDFDLHVPGENSSVMDALVARGYDVYAIDLRGYGATPRDASGWLTPTRAAEDVNAVLEWIHKQSALQESPALIAWSRGSLVAQLVAETHPDAMSALVLFGRPLRDSAWARDTLLTAPPRAPNTAARAVTDFITPGSISRAAVDAYVHQALASDPILVDWRNLDQFNALDAQRVKAPTLLMIGQFDPFYAQQSTAQAALFIRLGTADKEWVILPGGDHAALLERTAPRFVEAIASFLERPRAVMSSSTTILPAQASLVASPVASPPAQRSQILMLGTGTPVIDAAHSGTSIGILVRGSLYIFDAGPGVERRLLEAVAKGTKIDTIPAVFITHLHSDHTLGLAALGYYHGRNAAFRGGGPLTVYGPPGLSVMMGHIHAAWADDRVARFQVQPDSSSWQVRGGDVTAGIVYRDSNVVVKAFEVPHQPWPHAFGYRVETPDRVIVISGDTGPSDVVARECAGCDVLLHEVYSAVGLPKEPPRMQRYHSSAHTSTYELGEIATKAKPSLLVLYHQLRFGGATDDDLVREVRSRYNGRVVSARDLDVY